MDERLSTDTPDAQGGADTAIVERTSAEYLGRWARLVSTTNWEKGRIICQWRKTLIEAQAPVQSYSDEAWSRRVGNVSGQHVGRLRRVYQRFGSDYQQYAGLYWSHFQAALDWNDAEMWLEGATQNDWSVAQMRHRRWETLGSPEDDQPGEEDIITGEMDEDADSSEEMIPERISESTGVVQDPDSVDTPPATGGDEVPDDLPVDEPQPLADESPAAEPIRPFENLEELPEDLNEAFESFKLAILHHKLSGWREVPRGHVLAALDGLKQLALAPADD